MGVYSLAMPDDTERLRRAAREWTIGNLGRALLLVVAHLAAIVGVTTLASPVG